MESTKITNLNKLTKELKIPGTPKNSYSIGVHKNERTCIIFNDNKWSVYYSERGKTEELKEFENFIDARLEFLKQLISVLPQNY